LRRFFHREIEPGGGCVAAWNAGAAATGAPIVVQMSDDWLPPHKWDDLICERIGNVEKPSVLAVSDGVRQDNLLCMAICTRQYMAQDYYLFHPEFTGVYSDNWFTHVAYKRGQVIEARDLVFKHNHPAFGDAKMDKTYAEQNAPKQYEKGLEIYNRLLTGDDWSDVPGFFNYIELYDIAASRLKSGDTIAEIGVWMGRSIIYLAQLLKRQGKKVKIYAVDTFAGELNQPAHEAIIKAHGGSLRSVFEANIKRCGVEDMIEIVESDSAAAAEHVADGTLAFCYIDAAHDYRSVREDILAWKPKLKPGAIFAGHDMHHEPVQKAVWEIIPEAKHIGPCWLKLP
jgi:predicted O-methyltransferase YrrM